MARYTDNPTVPVRYLRPKRASFDIIGNSIDGGVNGTGEAISIEMSGGGRVKALYEQCVLQADDTERFEIINWLAARGNGGFRFFNVPLLTDAWGPFAARRPVIGGIPHSDGALFSDTSGYSQASVWGRLTASAALGAGKIFLRVYGASRPLRWSDWFSINHPTKGWRAYRYWESTKTEEGTEAVGGVELSYADYALGIAPALREACDENTRVELARPLCIMRFPQGFTLPLDVDGWLQARPTLQFTEAF